MTERKEWFRHLYGRKHFRLIREEILYADFLMAYKPIVGPRIFDKDCTLKQHKHQTTACSCKKLSQVLVLRPSQLSGAGPPTFSSIKK